MKFKSDIEVQAGLKDSAGNAGTSGQVLSTSGTSVSWVDPALLPADSAENLITEVYNETGATLTKGTVVYINGGHGNLPTITKALATSDATSAQTYGVVRADITNNNNGWVVVTGRLEDLDTQVYSPGTVLYLSSTTAGQWTSTKQYAPNHLVYVGIVVRSHPTQGIVEVKIQNGYELDELHNVAAQTPSNNDGIFYNTSNSLWEAKSISAAGGITGSGTTNYVSKFTSTSTLGDSLIYDNGTNVGIGTITPIAKLTLQNPNFCFFRAEATGSSPGAILVGSSGGYGIISSPSMPLLIDVNGGERMRIDTSGNVGIGTSSPTAKLHVSDTNKVFDGYGNVNIFTSDASAANKGGSIAFGGVNSTGGTSPYVFAKIQGVKEGISGTFAGALILGTTQSSSAITERMRITSAGNVGIGTSSPQQKLDVEGSVRSSAFYQISNGSTNVGFIGSQAAIFGAGGDDFTFYNGNATSNVFYTSGTERMRITSSGNVGIGTTNPASKLQSSGTSSGIFSALALESLVAGNPSSGNGVGIDFRINNSGNPSYVAGNISLINTYYRSNTDMAFSVAYADTLNERMRITSNGYVGIGTSVPNALLDVAGDALINGVTVGRGPGNDDTNTVVGNGAFSANISAQNNTIIGKWAGIGKQYGNGNIIIGANNYNSPDGAIVDYSNTISISRGSNIVAGGPPHIWAPSDVYTSSTVDVITVNYTTYRAMFVEYVIEDESGNIRGGYIKGIWNNDATIIKMTEETTSSIGNTSDYVFALVDNGSYSAALQLTSTSGDPVYCSVTSRLLTRPY